MSDEVEYPLYSDEIVKRAEDTATAALAMYDPSPAMIVAVTEAILDGYGAGIRDCAPRGDADVLAAKIAQAIREARLSAYEAAARIVERSWHTSGTDCDDRENCGIIIHNRYQPDAAAKLIRVLAEKEQS